MFLYSAEKGFFDSERKFIIMKNAKIILLVLIGVLLICSFGCGGGGGGVDSEGNNEPNNEQNPQNEQTDEKTSQFVEKILAPGADGAPAIFDYAPKPESSDESAAVDLQEVQFVKYIASKDLNSDGEYVKTIRLNKDSEYVIKYSHGGRSLNNASLNLRISAPDNNEMVLDLTSNGAPESSSNDYYVPTALEVIPDECPCIIMYRFKAPLTGDYEFAVSELTLVSGDGLVKNVSSDIPFEFRIYGSDEAYSAADDEEIELSPRQILDLQRMILSSATEFNDNGLPVFNADEGEVKTSGFDSDAIYLEILKRYAYNDYLREIAKRANVKPDAVINNVPYDKIFEEGAGFYAHSGLRGVTDVVDDEAFSRNAVSDFTMPTPGSGSANSMKENFSFNVIATEEEHDRAMELGAMSNFALLRDALGYTDRQDYARLGSDHTKIISVRYELIENAPRTPDPKIFKLYDDALDELKNKGSDYFTNEYGDYFVAGYTWGVRYDATIEIVTVPGVSFYDTAMTGGSFGDQGRYQYDAADICKAAAWYVMEVLKLAVKNAISERDTGKSLPSGELNDIEKYLEQLDYNFRNITLRVSHSNHIGRTGDIAFSLSDFASSLANFVKSAKKTPRSQYQKLYVTLRRYREIESVKPYIPEELRVKRSLYDAIRKLNETIFKARCYYNALMVLPASHLSNGTGLQNQWRNEFETELVTRMKNGLNYICADEGRVNEYYNKFNALYEKYKALAERYNFYRYFVLVQKNTSSPSWSDSDDDYDDYWTRGFETYDKSKIVQGDMKAGRYDDPRHIEEYNEGDGKADLSNSFSDEYVHWYRTGYHNTNDSTGYDVNGQTIGKRSFHWHYTGGASRRLEVYFKYRTIKMPGNLYPFSGL